MLTAELTKPVLIGEGETCRGCPRLTGIPPHVTLLNQMSRLQLSMEESSSRFASNLREELDRRSVGGDSFMANQLLQDVRRTNEEMRELLRGAVAVGQSRDNDNDGLPTPVAHHPDRPFIVDTGAHGQHTMYLWGGKMRGVPEGFILPKMSLQTLITYWYCGSRQPSVPPLRILIAGRDFPNKKSMKIVLCQMKRLITHVNRAGVMERFDFSQQQWTTRRGTMLYEAVAHRFAFPTKSGHYERRHIHLSWKTVHELLVLNYCKLVGEQV